MAPCGKTSSFSHLESSLATTRQPHFAPLQDSTAAIAKNALERSKDSAFSPCFATQSDVTSGFVSATTISVNGLTRRTFLNTDANQNPIVQHPSKITKLKLPSFKANEIPPEYVTEVDFSDLQDLSTEDLRCFMSFYPNLKKVKLPSCINEEILTALPKTQLKYLDLRNCQAISLIGFKHLVAFINLQYLNLSGCEKISDPLLEQLASRLTQLTYLDLTGCKHLTELSLKYLAKLPRLMRLSISECHGIKGVGLSSLTQLTHLSLSGCLGIEDNDLEHLANLTQLKHLNLQRIPHITDHKLAFLARLIQLTHLSFLGCRQLTDCGIGKLTPLSQLKLLDLRLCTNITSNGVSQLKEKIPEITIKV